MFHKKSKIRTYHSFKTKFKTILEIHRYNDNGGLALMLLDSKTKEDVADITVNIPPVTSQLASFYACVNNYNENEGMEDFIRNNHLGIKTQSTAQNGFITAPIYFFDRDRLKELDPDGFQRYVEAIQHSF